MVGNSIQIDNANDSSASFLGALYKKVQPKRNSNERWVRRYLSAKEERDKRDLTAKDMA